MTKRQLKTIGLDNDLSDFLKGSDAETTQREALLVVYGIEYARMTGDNPRLRQASRALWEIIQPGERERRNKQGVKELLQLFVDGMEREAGGRGGRVLSTPNSAGIALDAPPPKEFCDLKF